MNCTKCWGAFSSPLSVFCLLPSARPLFPHHLLHFRSVFEHQDEGAGTGNCFSPSLLLPPLSRWSGVLSPVGGRPCGRRRSPPDLAGQMPCPRSWVSPALLPRGAGGVRRHAALGGASASTYRGPEKTHVPKYRLKLLQGLAGVQGVLFSHYIAILREIRNYFHVRFIQSIRAELNSE